MNVKVTRYKEGSDGIIGLIRPTPPHLSLVISNTYAYFTISILEERGRMATVTLEKVKKIYHRNTVAVEDFNLHIEDGEFIDT